MCMRVFWPNMCVCGLLCSVSERVVWAQISSPDLLKVKAAGIFMLFICFFFLLLFFSRSFVAGVKKPFWHSALLFFVCIICGMLLSLFASFKLKVFPRMYAVANLVRLWQTINPMSRMPCRQKYINKFCLYSAIFLLFLVSFFYFAFYTLFSLHSGKHTGNDLCEPQANTHLIHHSF